MNINISAERRYLENTFYVLNKIKTELLRDLNKNRVIDYMFNVNIIVRPHLSLVDEREILHNLISEKIISKIGDTDIVEIGKKGTPKYEVYEIYHFKVSKRFERNYDQRLKTQNASQGYCWFENNTFILILHDGSTKSISFDTERGKRQIVALFQTLVEHWKLNGNDPIKAMDIIKGMSKFGSIGESCQIKNIISNVRKTKINPANLQNKIQINYDSKAGGWRINIYR